MMDSTPKDKTNYCQCGCGEIVKNRFKKGHHCRQDHIRKKLSIDRMGEKNHFYGKKLSSKRIKEITEFMRNNHPRKGVILTDETKRKISESNKGKGKGIPKPKSKESIEKQRASLKKRYASGELDSLRGKLREIGKTRIGDKNWLFGKKHTVESKMSMSKTKKEKFKNGEIIPSWVGRHHTEESRQKLAQYCGPLASNWKGGISIEPYCHVWTDEEYKKDIMKRDGDKCQNPFCSHEFNKIVIHHINYNKKDCAPQNLITLCNSCNSKANFNREYWEVLYNIKNTNYHCSIRE